MCRAIIPNPPDEIVAEFEHPPPCHNLRLQQPPAGGHVSSHGAHCSRSTSVPKFAAIPAQLSSEPQPDTEAGRIASVYSIFWPSLFRTSAPVPVAGRDGPKQETVAPMADALEDTCGARAGKRASRATRQGEEKSSTFTRMSPTFCQAGGRAGAGRARGRGRGRDASGGREGLLAGRGRGRAGPSQGGRARQGRRGPPGPGRSTTTVGTGGAAGIERPSGGSSHGAAVRPAVQSKLEDRKLEMSKWKAAAT